MLQSLENSLAISKAKHSYQMTQSFCHQGIKKPKGNKNIGPQKNLYMNILSSIIHDGYNVETTWTE